MNICLMREQLPLQVCDGTWDALRCVYTDLQIFYNLDWSPMFMDT